LLKGKNQFQAALTELVGGTDNFAQDPPEITDLDEPAGYVAPLESLWGGAVLAYGVQECITYEDGSSARFSELDSEQAENDSLVSESVPSIEEKYNLDEDEVNLLNTLRDSDMTSEEFINSLITEQTVSAQRELSTTDYEAVSDDGIL
jgi:hypothetical protein